jgi:hypothetical protein
MTRLNLEKLHVSYFSDATPEDLILPRRYTLTHSDVTGELFLSIGIQYNKKQISGLYTRLMRDEVLAELNGNEEHLEYRVYCHVSGGIALGTAGWRYNIFRSELPLVLEAIRYGDRALFDQNPKLDHVPIYIHFESNKKQFNQIEQFGTMSGYIV